MSAQLQRIAADLAHCKQRITEMQSGARGQIPTEAMHINAGLAFENQLLAQRSAVARLEGEYVQAMIGEHKWCNTEIIRRMSLTMPEVEIDESPSAPADSSARKLGGTGAEA